MTIVYRRQTSVWDALDKIGREPERPQQQSVSSDAMVRIQERTAEQKQEREKEATELERAKLEREGMEQEMEQGFGMGFGP